MKWRRSTLSKKSRLSVVYDRQREATPEKLLGSRITSSSITARNRRSEYGLNYLVLDAGGDFTMSMYESEAKVLGAFLIRWYLSEEEVVAAMHQKDSEG